MLKAQIFHAIAVDKIPKVHGQLNDFLATIGDDDIVSVNTSEVSFSGVQSFYSYTVLLVYKSK